MINERYENLLTNVCLVMGDMREELGELYDSMESDPRNALQYKHIHDTIQRYLDALNTAIEV